MSESPGSTMERQPTRKYRPQAVPRSMLSEGQKDVGSRSKFSRQTRLPTSRVVVHARLGQHGVVLQLRLPQRRAVTRNNDELGWNARQLGSGAVPLAALLRPKGTGIAGLRVDCSRDRRPLNPLRFPEALLEFQYRLRTASLDRGTPASAGLVPRSRNSPLPWRMLLSVDL